MYLYVLICILYVLTFQFSSNSTKKIGLLERFIFKEGRMSEKTHGQVALLIMFVLVLGLMQATHYAKASHLMGAFIAGLVFCTDHELHVMFVSQFKRILQVCGIY